MKTMCIALFMVAFFQLAYTQNVGIGTSSPTAKLHVAGNMAIDSGIRVNARNVSVPFLVEGARVNQFLDQNVYQYFTSNGSFLPAWQSFTAGVSGTLVQVDLYTMYNTPSSRVLSIYAGEGTQGPLLQSVTFGSTNNFSWKSIPGFSVPLVEGQTYTLQIDKELYWAYANTDVYSGGISSKGNSFDYNFRTIVDNVNDQLLRIGENGNVGLGVSLPTERLDVKGNVKVSGNVSTQGNLTIQGSLTATGSMSTSGSLNIAGFLTQNPPQNLSLVNSWQNFGESYGNAKIFLDKQKAVRLSGLVKNGTGAIISQLPTGYRPDTDLIFTVVSGQGFARLDIKANGYVQLVGNYSNAYVSLDGISFQLN